MKDKAWIHINIVMATFNGAEYLKEQLESIYQQDYPHFSIWVYDDCSTDGTRDILERERKKGLINVRYNETNIGFLENFKRGIQNNSEKYIALSDQDDIWKKDKLSILAKELKILEEDPNIPCLVYSDLSVIDQEGRNKYASFWQQTQRGHYDHALQTILFGNVVNGCTTLFNPALSNCIEDLPKGFPQNHDGWLCLFAFTFGRVKGVKKPLVEYRQHEVNVTYDTTKRNNLISKIKKNISYLINPDDYLVEALTGAQLFYETYESKMQPNIAQLFREFLSLRGKGYLEKRRVLKGSFDSYWH